MVWDVDREGEGKTTLPKPFGVRSIVSRPRQSLLAAFEVCGAGRNSEELAVPVEVRDRVVGVVAASWHNLGDLLESSVDDFAGKLSLGPRDSDVSTGWAATSPREPA